MRLEAARFGVRVLRFAGDRERERESDRQNENLIAKPLTGAASLSLTDILTQGRDKR